MIDDTAALYRDLLGMPSAPAVANGNGRLRLT
jgi:hypothetical protein